MAFKSLFKRISLKNVRHWVVCILLGGLMLLVMIWWQNQEIALSVETIPLKIESCLAHTLFNNWGNSKYTLKDFLFIDVSHEKEVVLDNNTGQKEVITDRKLLDTLFQQLARAGTYRYIVCDLTFPTATPYDSIFRLTINKLPRAGFVNDGENTGNQAGGFLAGLPGASGNYSFVTSWYQLAQCMFKFPLYDKNNHATFPLYMYQQVEGTRVNGGCLFLTFKNRYGYYFSKVPYDPVIRPYALLKTSSPKPLFDMNGLLVNISGKDAVSLKNFFADKIVVISDLDNDHHTTIYGESPGSLLLINTFISLANGDNVIGYGWLFTMLVCFSFFAHFFFFQEQSFPAKCYRKLRFLLQYLFNDSLSELIVNLVLFSAVSLLSYMVFHTSAEIFFLTIVITSVQFFQRKWINWRMVTANYPGWWGFTKYFFHSLLRKGNHADKI